ncbi:MmcQ/YjbR family DNA-binding protein [Umezawaea sp. Da 62-37]|uniref:MmcQ/YjbR family DNA-binding protein n=1 Tax=Umezawaea sp. Da 62-37 TaxID=3075927 RepID=UPI0028F72591|nr:MmcQ/YjbR family DNA-binding protein [Umezawaea sp. Da 62-37]WNV89531.1 MmcQ/YjbR family DNA-binding protein [Umezawaea sp. Da 62-37]
MTLDDLIAHCLAKPGAEETYPWGDAELVCKVAGKAFAFIGLDAGTIGLKCPNDAEELRDRYPDDVKASAYIGRYGWNSVRANGGVPVDELRELVDRSYEAVVSKLPKAKRP